MTLYIINIFSTSRMKQKTYLSKTFEFSFYYIQYFEILGKERQILLVRSFVTFLVLSLDKENTKTESQLRLQTQKEIVPHLPLFFGCNCHKL